MVNIYKLQLTNLQQEILRLLFIKAGKKLNQNQLAKALKVSPPGITKALPYLEKKELIALNQDRESKRWEISLNTNNQDAIWLKRADNLKQIYESGLAKFLQDNLQAATIILFGSYSTGEDTFNSDIDIAAIGIKPRQLNLENFERLLERKININYYGTFKSIDRHLLNNILNGIVLKGSIEI